MAKSPLLAARRVSSQEAEKLRARTAGIIGTFPEATAVLTSGVHLKLQVRDKRFGWFMEDHHGDGRVTVECKSTAPRRAALMASDPAHVYVPSYGGHRGWLGHWLDVPKVDWTLVETILRDAYRLTAPKTLAATMATATWREGTTR